MGAEPLVNEQIDAGWEFVKDFSDYVTVDAAFWANWVDSDFWHLYIASSEIEPGRLRAAYGEVIRRASANPSQWLDVQRFKLVNTSDPLAAKVIELRDLRSLKTGMWFGGSSIVGVAVNRVYIYPAMAVASSAP